MNSFSNPAPQRARRPQRPPGRRTAEPGSPQWLTENFQPRKPGARPSKLDPFKNDIRRMLENYPTVRPRSFGISVAFAIDLSAASGSAGLAIES